MLANKMHEIEHLVSVSQTLREDLTLSNNRYDELTEENCILKTSIAGKEDEIKNLITESRTLNDNLAESENRYREMSDENMKLRSSIAGKEGEFAIEVRDLFSHHLDMVNDLCRVWFSNINKDMSGNTVYLRLTKILGAMNQIEVIEELTRIIDKYDNNWFARFKELFPDLKDSEYRLAIYLYLGFRPSTIAVLSNHVTIDAVYIAKYKLKKKLTKNIGEQTESLVSKLFM